MNLFKTLQAFFRRLFLSVTPAGRSTLMYEKAYNNINETHTISVLEKRIIKSQVNFYVHGLLKRKRLTDVHLAQLVKAKFGKELEAAGLKWQNAVKDA